MVFLKSTLDIGDDDDARFEEAEMAVIVVRRRRGHSSALTRKKGICDVARAISESGEAYEIKVTWEEGEKPDVVIS